MMAPPSPTPSHPCLSFPLGLALRLRQHGFMVMFSIAASILLAWIIKRLLSERVRHELEIGGTAKDKNQCRTLTPVK